MSTRTNSSHAPLWSLILGLVIMISFSTVGCSPDSLLGSDEGNIVFTASDGGNEINSDGGNEINSDGGNEVNSDGGNEIASDGGNEIASDGGNEIASDGGNEIASDGGNE